MATGPASSSSPSSSSVTAPTSSVQAEICQFPPGLLIGYLISVTAKSGIRYEGSVSAIDTENRSIKIHTVRSHGTEGRREGGLNVASRETVYDSAHIYGEDIKEIRVLSMPPDLSDIHQDPAIIEAYPSQSQLTASHGNLTTAEVSNSGQSDVARPTIFEGFTQNVSVSAPSSLQSAGLKYHCHSSVIDHTKQQSNSYQQPAIDKGSAPQNASELGPSISQSAGHFHPSVMGPTQQQSDSYQQPAISEGFAPQNTTDQLPSMPRAQGPQYRNHSGVTVRTQLQSDLYQQPTISSDFSPWNASDSVLHNLQDYYIVAIHVS